MLYQRISYIFFCFTVLFFIYFFYILWFYWSNYGGCTQVVLFFKYRQCLIILPSVRTRVYAFGAPASCLRVWCTNHCLRVATWLIRGEAHQYIDHVVCFIQWTSIIQPNKTTITTLRDISLRSCVPTRPYHPFFYAIRIP